MEIISVRLGRAIWLFDTRDINPRGMNLWPIFAAVRERYHFQTYPKTAEDIDLNSAKGLVLGDGLFGMGDKHYTVSKVTIFQDGIIADTAVSTDFAERFVEDLLSFVSGQFGLTFKPEMVNKKAYVSELIVKTDKDPERLYSPLSTLTNRLSELTGELFHPFGISLSVDHKLPIRPANFQFEREINKPFDQRRYYSLAPVKTEDHTALLEILERAL